MKCPHCLEGFHDEQTLWSVSLGDDVEGMWLVERRMCPACRRLILTLKNGRLTQGVNPGGPGTPNVHFVQLIGARSRMVWPKGLSRAPVPPEVPTAIAEDYMEACVVLGDSATASAALSRRCLQNILRQAAAVKPGDLSVEIQQVIDSGKLPTPIAENIDAVRNIGNFAAHPNKSQSTGQILPVEPEEAEWNLDVLESLFDFYYVQPARAQAKRDALNKKLADAKKPPMK